MQHNKNNKQMEKFNINDLKQTIKNLIKCSKPFIIPLVIAIILSILASVCSIIGPNKVQDLTNIIVEGILTGINMEKVKNIFITLVIIYTLSLVFNYLQSVISTIVTNKISNRLRNDISKKINKLPLKYFDNTEYGDILSIVVNDVSTLSNSLSDCVSVFFSSIVLFIGSIIMMFVTNYIMAITAIVSTLIGFVIMAIIIFKSQKYFLKQQKYLGELNGCIEETYSSHNIINVYNAKEEVNKKFDDINERLTDNARKSSFLSGLMPQVMNFIGNFSYVCICVVGASLVINKTIDIGVIVAFMIYTRLFTSPLVNMAQVASELQSATAAGLRVFKFLDEEEMEEEQGKKLLLPSKVKGNINFEHVSFAYDEKPIIKDFNASIKKGQKVAIVGPTGAGKTTIVNLLMKFYKINKGKITIDGIDINDLTRENVHDLFVMVLQDTWSFNGTIYENIVYNNKNVSNEEVERVCNIVGLDHYIKTLPNGYNTMLKDSDTLSQGEKQLLTIARGMLKDSPFLILDEATSNVDTRTEELVQKAMDKLTKGKTSFIIAHRLSTIKNADLILVLKNGNIIEQGTHEELLKKKGFYEELYNSQFEEV